MKVIANAVRQEGNKRYTNGKGRNKTVFVHKSHDHLYRKSKKVTKELELAIIARLQNIRYTSKEQVEFEITYTTLLIFTHKKEIAGHT